MSSRIQRAFFLTLVCSCDDNAATSHPDCDERAAAARNELVAALATVDRVCVFDRDCVMVSEDDQCNQSCGSRQAVSVQGAARISGVVGSNNKKWCSDFGPSGSSQTCETSVEGCTRPVARPLCVQGLCQADSGP